VRRKGIFSNQKHYEWKILHRNLPRLERRPLSRLAVERISTVSINYFSEDRVEKLDLSVIQAINNIKQLGRGSAKLEEKF